MRIAVIGGGPSGVMSAITAAQNGAEVTLFDKNEKIGKKLYISGKGRCNLTNNCAPQEFLTNVVNNGKFLYGSIFKFTPSDAMDFCERHGLALKTERGNRVFPNSDKSSDVIKMFAGLLRENNVNLRLNCKILSVELDKNGFLLTTISDIVCFDKVIIATGGVSYGSTGSTGDGYVFARKLGHKIVDVRPALCRLLCADVAELEGLALKNVLVSLKDNELVIDSEFGEMLFAKDAVTGPAVLTLSSRINKIKSENLFVAIDLKPALDCEKLDARILRDFSKKMNKNFINALDDLLPERLIKTVARLSGIPLDKKVNQITFSERNKLIKVIKSLSFKYLGTDSIDFAIVTAGGVDVKEVNSSTMESKLVKNLYFCGEVLDVDAYTGGFNIQIALSTGYSAGKSASCN